MMLALAMMLVATAGVVEPTAAPELAAAYEPRRVALIVGVQQYADPELQGLRYPEADAKELYQVLHRPDVGGFDEAVVLMGGANTTKAAIENAIAWATAELQRDDTFLLYFSGHGTLSFDLVEGSQLYFLPSDAQLNDPQATGISVAWLEDVVSSLPSRRRVLILDTCHNGRSGKSAVNASTAQLLGAMRGAPPEPRGLKDVSETEARLYAAQFYQPALEDPNLGNGVYTHFLLEALTDAREDADLDGDGLVDVAELHDYARDRTMAHTGGIQVPRAEYHFVGHDEIYLGGDPSLRSTAERALLSACDELLAKARILVDGIPRGELPGVMAIDPGRHDVEVQTASGHTLLKRSIHFAAGTILPVEDLMAERRAHLALLGGPSFRTGPALLDREIPTMGELELVWLQPVPSPYWLRPDLHLRVDYGRGAFPDSEVDGTGSELEVAVGPTFGLRMGPLSVGPLAEIGFRGRNDPSPEQGKGGAFTAAGGRALVVVPVTGPDIAIRYDLRGSWQRYGGVDGIPVSTTQLLHHGVAVGAVF